MNQPPLTPEEELSLRSHSADAWDATWAHVNGIDTCSRISWKVNNGPGPLEAGLKNQKIAKKYKGWYIIQPPTQKSLLVMPGFTNKMLTTLNKLGKPNNCN